MRVRHGGIFALRGHVARDVFGLLYDELTHAGSAAETAGL